LIESLWNCHVVVVERTQKQKFPPLAFDPSRMRIGDPNKLQVATTNDPLGSKKKDLALLLRFERFAPSDKNSVISYRNCTSLVSLIASACFSLLLMVVWTLLQLYYCMILESLWKTTTTSKAKSRNKAQNPVSFLHSERRVRGEK